MSCSVTPRRRVPIGLKPLDGAKDGVLLDLELATGPAWPICAATAAPSSWTASVSCRRPGRVLGGGGRGRAGGGGVGERGRDAPPCPPRPHRTPPADGNRSVHR